MVFCFLAVNQRAILSRLGVETASNSFHLSMSPSSIFAGGFWSDLNGHDLRNTQALFSAKANDYRHSNDSYRFKHLKNRAQQSEKVERIGR